MKNYDDLCWTLNFISKKDAHLLQKLLAKIMNVNYEIIITVLGDKTIYVLFV